MKLPNKAYQEFQQLYQKGFKKTLSINEAQILANRFIQLFQVITTDRKVKYENTKE